MKYSQADIEKVRRDFAFTLKPWVDGSPHATMSEGNDWYSMLIGPPFEAFNMVWIASLSKDSLDAALSDLEQRNLAGHVRLSGAGLLHGKELLARGCTLGGATLLWPGTLIKILRLSNFEAG